MKFIGLVLIFTACSLAGVVSAAKKADMMKYTEALISLISFMKFKISNCRTELYDIYGEFENEYMNRRGILKILKDDGFKAALEYSCLYAGFEENEARALFDFADKLGSSDVHDQIENIDYVMKVLDARFDDQKKNYPSQKKLYISLGMLAGALAVIILF